MSNSPEEPDPLDPLLDRLGESTPPLSRSVAPEVWRRIAAGNTPGPSSSPSWLERLNAIFARPSFAGAFVAACVLLGLFLAEVRTSRRQAQYGGQIAQSYLRLIDPLLAAGVFGRHGSGHEAMKRTLLILLLGLGCGAGAHYGWLVRYGRTHENDLAAQLAWMKTNLQLNDEQLARLRVLHEQSAPRLLALAAQVAGMKDELAAFEHERLTTGRIDFLEFARYVEQRRMLDRACLDSTRTLVSAAANVMTPQQREHYMSLLGPALEPARANAIR